MNTTENNKLIVKFLEWECLDKYSKKVTRYKTPFKIVENKGEGYKIINEIIFLSNSANTSVP